MKKIITLSTILALSTGLLANTDMQEQIDALTKKIEKLEKKQKKNTKKISKVNKLANKDNIKFDVDFRTAVDMIEYETANGTKYKNDSLYSNRLWLGMGYAPTSELLFKGQLSFHKAFGASYGQRGTGMGFDTFDWVVNENLTDDKLRVREAFWLWMPTVAGVPMTVSVGRRPATNGYLINLRDDDKAKSPMGHIINMEFDGASVSAKLDSLAPGMMVKLCAGRGLTNAVSWSSQASSMATEHPTFSTQPNYTEDKNSLDNVDMLGLIFKPYDDGQYSVMTKYYRGFNVPGMFMTDYDFNSTPMDPTDDKRTYTMQSAGEMDGAAVSFKVEGIGEEISDFLDETVIFASYAWSKTIPNTIDRSANAMMAMQQGGMADDAMLGSDKSETGTSYWVGIQTPNMTGGKFGLEYNKGDKYWRSFTYGEDTMIGSKMAVRGSAIEAYWTQPIIEKIFSMQVRYTKIDYDYTGSNAFFGDGGTPMTMAEAKAMGMNPVESASDLRVYFRYRY